MTHFDTPTSAAVEQELQREKYKRRYRRTLRSTLVILITAAALAVLVATLWLPVLQIYGSSMAPCLNEGEIVLSIRDDALEQGDVVAFYYGNKLLIKRYIAGPGQWVTIQEDGTVLVDGQVLDEPYVQEKTLGSSDLEFPYQVPDGKYFLMGDHRLSSVDSRHSSVGCISADQIVGKIIYRVWPLTSLGTVN